MCILARSLEVVFVCLFGFYCFEVGKVFEIGILP